MGIYDRDYYRRDGPSFLGSLAGQGRVTNWLIGLNVVCFLLQMLTRTRVGPLWNEPFTDALILDVPRSSTARSGACSPTPSCTTPARSGTSCSTC